MDVAQIVGLSKAQGFQMVLLLMGWAQLLFGGMLAGTPTADNSRRMPAWTRMSSSIALVLAAWSWWGFTNDTILQPMAFWMAVGMTFGFIGDLFMANLLRVPPVNHVIMGMVAFGIGHIAYIVGMLRIAADLSLDSQTTYLVAVIVWWMIAVAVWYRFIFSTAGQGDAPPRSAVHIAALPYALLLATTTGIAFGLAAQDLAFVLLAIGAMLFLISDVILAMRLFNNLNMWLIDDIVWLTYGPGQMFIVYALTVAALGVSAPFL